MVAVCLLLGIDVFVYLSCFVPLYVPCCGVIVSCFCCMFTLRFYMLVCRMSMLLLFILEVFCSHWFSDGPRYPKGLMGCVFIYIDVVCVCVSFCYLCVFSVACHVLFVCFIICCRLCSLRWPVSFVCCYVSCSNLPCAFVFLYMFVYMFFLLCASIHLCMCWWLWLFDVIVLVVVVAWSFLLGVVMLYYCVFIFVVVYLFLLVSLRVAVYVSFMCLCFCCFLFFSMSPRGGQSQASVRASRACVRARRDDSTSGVNARSSPPTSDIYIYTYNLKTKTAVFLIWGFTS